MRDVTISNYQFLKQFPDVEAARLHLEARRWNGSPVCPHCAEKERITTRKAVGFYRCNACKQDFTVRTDTIFERSHIPLDKWLFVMYLMATARKSISSLQISKELGITQKSAWFMQQRIREACGNGAVGSGTAGPLIGVIEADATYIGGLEKNKHASKRKHLGRGGIGKTAVLGMRERGGDVDAVVLPAVSRQTVQAEIAANVNTDAILCTDEQSAYVGVPQRHRTVRHSAKQYVDGMAHTNGIESVWALLKRVHYGTFHHFSAEHAQRYVDEFTFPLNEGKCKIPSMDRVNSLADKTVGVRLTYAELTA